MNPIVKFFSLFPNVHTLHARITAVYEFWLSLYTMLCKLVPAAPVQPFSPVTAAPQYSAPVAPAPEPALPADHNAETSGALGESALAQSPAAVAL